MFMLQSVDIYKSNPFVIVFISYLIIEFIPPEQQNGACRKARW